MKVEAKRHAAAQYVCHFAGREKETMYKIVQRRAQEKTKGRRKEKGDGNKGPGVLQA
jgi:hypothetical protein